jgi:hypothetical protein
MMVMMIMIIAATDSHRYTSYSSKPWMPRLDFHLVFDSRPKWILLGLDLGDDSWSSYGYYAAFKNYVLYCTDAVGI